MCIRSVEILKVTSVHQSSNKLVLFCAFPFFGLWFQFYNGGAALHVVFEQHASELLHRVWDVAVPLSYLFEFMVYGFSSLLSKEPKSYTSISA